LTRLSAACRSGSIPHSVLFVLHEKHFAHPPDYHIECVHDPRAWYNSVMVEIHTALGPVAPRAN
jgi:hypothetical protein